MSGAGAGEGSGGQVQSGFFLAGLNRYGTSLEIEKQRAHFLRLVQDEWGSLQQTLSCLPALPNNVW